MPEMRHKVYLHASPEVVFEAIATARGLSSWWTDDVTLTPVLGSVAQIAFNRRAVVLHMSIDELVARKKLTWTCLGDLEEWRGTLLTWELEPQRTVTALSLTHSRWRTTGGTFAESNTNWGVLLFWLRDYVEGRNPGPYYASRR